MALLSAQQIFSEDQAITATAASTNILDLGATGTPYGGAAALTRDVGKGNPVHLLFMVTEAFNTLTTLTVSVQVDDNSSFSSATTVFDQAIPLASLVVGYTLPIQFVPNGVNERYVRMYYTVGGSNPSTGQITCGVSLGNQTNIT